MRVLARGIEDARNVTIEGPEGRDPRELDRAIIFSRASYRLSHRQDGRHAAFRCGDGIDEMHDSLRRDSSFTPPGSSSGWGKRLFQATTQLRNRIGTQAVAGQFVPALIGSRSR